MPAAHARTMPQGSGTQCLSFCTLPGGVRIDCACIVKSSWGTLKAHQDSFWCPSGGKPENNRRHAFQFVKIYLAYMERHGLVNDEGVLEVCVMFILWLLPKGQRAADEPAGRAYVGQPDQGQGVGARPAVRAAGLAALVVR